MLVLKVLYLKTFLYPTNATITTTIERTEKKVNSYALEIKKSEFLGERVSEAVNASFRMSGTIFRLLEFHSGVDRQFGSNYEK
ncbi:12650_t:CDS:2, partial [Funneliformis geosporum]